MHVLDDKSFVESLKAIHLGISTPVPIPPSPAATSWSRTYYETTRQAQRTRDAALSAAMALALGIATARIEAAIRLLLAWPASIPEGVLQDSVPEAMSALAEYRERRPDGVTDGLAPVADALQYRLMEPADPAFPEAHDDLIDILCEGHSYALDGNAGMAAARLLRADRLALALSANPLSESACPQATKRMYEAVARELGRARDLMQAIAELQD